MRTVAKIATDTRLTFRNLLYLLIRGIDANVGAHYRMEKKFPKKRSDSGGGGKLQLDRSQGLTTYEDEGIAPAPPNLSRLLK